MYQVLYRVSLHHRHLITMTTLQGKDWRTLRLREVEFLAHGHSACQWQHLTTLLGLSYSHSVLETVSENTPNVPQAPLSPSLPPTLKVQSCLFCTKIMTRGAKQDCSTDYNYYRQQFAFQIWNVFRALLEPCNQLSLSAQISPEMKT